MFNDVAIYLGRVSHYMSTIQNTLHLKNYQVTKPIVSSFHLVGDRRTVLLAVKQDGEATNGWVKCCSFLKFQSLHVISANSLVG